MESARALSARRVGSGFAVRGDAGARHTAAVRSQADQGRSAVHVHESCVGAELDASGAKGAWSGVCG